MAVTKKGRGVTTAQEFALRHDHTKDFRAAMLAKGLEPPEVIEPGKLHRFPGVGKENGNTAGWCKLFADGMGGVFGDWSSGLSETWRMEREKPFSTQERAAFERQVAEARAKAEAERLTSQEDAAKKAEAIWNAAKPATAEHPYLRRKGIQPHGAWLHQGALVVPLRCGSKLHSLQFIMPDGKKRFLPGGKATGSYHLIGDPTNADAICIAEGFATGASIHEATGLPVAVAFNAGNLKGVALIMRERFPGKELIVCADDDWKTDGNPGLSKATDAAQATGGKLAIPDFGDDRDPGMTDFNDLAVLRGPEVVRRAIGAAAMPAVGDDWPKPQPLTAKVEAEPYPLDALPDAIRAAVEEVQSFVKAPVPLVASSALAALSLACQAHVDVKRAEKLQGPTGLFFLTIADSGERKTTCDGFFTSAIREYEDEQVELMKPAIKEYQAAIAAWEAERDGILSAVKDAGRKNKPTDRLRAELTLLQQEKPEPPRVPRLILGDETPENLAWSLAKQWPSAGVLSSEAGVVFGAHAMGKDSAMRNMALLNILWDGGVHSVGRRTTESFTVRGARLTAALQVQEPTLREFFARSGALARGSGFLARFLIAWPESTQGQRPFSEAPASWPHLAMFHRRIAAILEQPAPIDDDGRLSPVMLSLTKEAKGIWVEFHDAIEAELSNGGELYDIRDVASKAADNAARLAALFHVFEHGVGGAIGAESIDNASRIVAWHLLESRRFFGELALPAELADAARLDAWLGEYCRRERTHAVGKSVALQYGPLRKKESLDAAIRELSELDRLRVLKEGKRTMLAINPALLGFANAKAANPANDVGV